MLLALGETFGKMGELESAAGVLSRALDEISQPRWAELETHARHALGVQGRIRAALGFVFLEQELTEPASEALHSGAECLLEAHDVSSGDRKAPPRAPNRRSIQVGRRGH